VENVRQEQCIWNGSSNFTKNLECNDRFTKKLNSEVKGSGKIAEIERLVRSVKENTQNEALIF
jgi:hypothetical protein